MPKLSQRFAELRGMYSDNIEEQAPAKRRKWPYWVGAGALVAAMGIGGYFLANKPERGGRYEHSGERAARGSSANDVITGVGFPDPFEKGMRYEVDGDITLRGFSFPEWEPVEKYLRTTTIDGAPLLRALILGKIIPSEKRKEIEEALGIYPPARQLLGVEYKLWGSKSPMIGYEKVVVRDEDPLHVLAYYLLLKENKHVIYNPGKESYWPDKRATRIKRKDGKIHACIYNFIPEATSAPDFTAAILGDVGDTREFVEYTVKKFNAVTNGQYVRPLSDHEDFEQTDRLYREACRIFDGFEDFNPEAEEVIKVLRGKGSLEGKGIYLSALLNETALDTLILDEFPEHEIIGYSIAKGKTLVLGSGAKAGDVGVFGEGNVLNWGEVNRLALYARGGFQGNWGKARNFAEKTRGGFQGNWGEAERMAGNVEGGFQGNWGEVKNYFALSAEGGFQGNWGDLNPKVRESVFVNWGARIINSINLGEVGLGKIGGVIETRPLISYNARAEEALQQLSEKMDDIDFLKKFGTYGSPEAGRVLEQIRSFDFPAFQSEVEQLSKNLKKELNTKE